MNKNYITSKLYGRLGNNMFQIAHAYAKAKKYNKSIVFPINEGANNTARKYKDNIFRKLDFYIEYATDNNAQIVAEDNHIYAEYPPIENAITAYDGYFQSEKYFINAKEEVIDLFSPPAEFIQKATSIYPYINFNEALYIQVRRGDYLDIRNVLPVITKEYIQYSIERISEHKHIVVTSDDIEWCKQHIQANNITYINLQEHECIWLGSLCKYFIISNSSFGWWAAYLSKNKNKQIYAPYPWFGLGTTASDINIIPTEWNKVSCYIHDGYLYPNK